MNLKKLSLMAVAALLIGAPLLGEVTTNVKVPIALGVFVPCAAGGAGEVVVLTGDLHILISATINGNNVHVRSHSQPMGVSGVGAVTGDRYQGTGITRQDLNFDGVDGFPFNFSFVNNFKIIGQGPGNNLLIHQNVHLTINANGETTVTVDNFRSECK